MSEFAWYAAGVATALVVATPLAWFIARRAVLRVRNAEAHARRTERLAELGAMTAGLAHEIKNPLSTISLNAQILTEDIADLAVDQQERARMVRRLDGLGREVERLSDILQDFLRFAGELRLHLAPTDANEIVDSFADFYAPQAERQGVRLRAELHPGDAQLVADAAQLKQAILNLAINAVQAMHDTGGELMLRVRPVQSAQENTIEIHVIDTGPGMSDDVLERIFTPYFTTKGGGSGLGLPTTRRIIEEHGGTVRVHSEPGRGTDFILSLPVDGPQRTDHLDAVSSSTGP